MNEKLIEKIISVAYGDAGFIDRIHIGILAMKDKEVMELLNEYRKTAGEVHSLREEEYPEEAVNKILKAADIGGKEKHTFVADIFGVFVRRPFAASAAAFLLVGLLVTTMFITNREPELKFSHDEISKAGEDTRIVFKAIDELINGAGDLIIDNVLKEKVAAPINENLLKVSNIINEGEIK